MTAIALTPAGSAAPPFTAHPPQLVRVGGFWVRSDNLKQDLVVIKDIFEQDAYRTRLLADRAGPDEVVVDIGAHIGTFACLWHRKNPQAKIVCVEACPENLAALHANVGHFAHIVPAACTYEPDELMLLNAVRPDCESTGGSVVVPRVGHESNPLRQAGYNYWDDFRELPKVTLEDLMSRFGFDRIDILKLDCEGSEYSILEKTTVLDRIRMIVGEYHFCSRWESFRRRRLDGWDYGHMHDGGEGGGLFHYANPVWPPATASPAAMSTSNGQAELAESVVSADVVAPAAADSLPAAPGEQEFLNRLGIQLHADDRGHWPAWEPHYRALYRIAHSIQPRTVIEFGVRCGYSALTFVSAVPGAQVTGYDAALERQSYGYLCHAESLLAGREFRLIRADTQGLDRMAPSDLCYLDGDQSLAGCLRDLELAYWSARSILVNSPPSRPEVREAVAAFLARHPGVFEVRSIDSGTGAGFSLLQRAVQQVAPRPLMQPPLLRVAVPAGIGDSVWALTKIPHLLRLYGAEQAHIGLCGSAPYRALSFVDRFDFVGSAENTRWECVEAHRSTPEGVYNWAPSGIGWHHEFDWMLQANRHLESGLRLETWLPEFETDWHIADRFRFTAREIREAREFDRQHGPYCVFYLGPESGNTNWGHNRGPLWTPEQWGELARHFRELGLNIVVVGAPYDRSYFDKHVGRHLGDCVNAIGNWSIGQTFSIVQRARCVISYQSGIGIFAVYLGVPTTCFWRPFGDSIEEHAFVSFQEGMASAWAPPEALATGRYLPSIYTKCTPDSIIQHAVRHDWHRA